MSVCLSIVSGPSDLYVINVLHILQLEVKVAAFSESGQLWNANKGNDSQDFKM